LVGIEWLGNDLDGPGIANVLLDLAGREFAGDNQNQNVVQPGILLNRSTKRKTVHPRHDDIRDEQVDVAALDAEKCIFTIDCFDDDLPHPGDTLQTTPDVEPRIGVVIRHENRDAPRWCAVLVSRPIWMVCVHA